MKLAELLETVEWEEVKNNHFLDYYESEETVTDFLLLFSKLHRLEPVESGMRIIIREADLSGNPDDLEEGEEIFYQLIGKNGTLNKEIKGFEYHRKADDPGFAHSETEYELIYVAWEEWLGMEVDEQTLRDYTAPQIAARCMAEMTLISFDPFEIRREKEGFREELDVLNTMTAEERKKCPNWEALKISFEKILSI